LWVGNSGAGAGDSTVIMSVWRHNRSSKGGGRWELRREMKWSGDGNWDGMGRGTDTDGRATAGSRENSGPGTEKLEGYYFTWTERAEMKSVGEGWARN
jgi:hypothetical protein